MRGFDKDDFDKHFDQIEKTAKWGIIAGLIGSLISALVGLGVLGFIGWVIVKLLQHNGVL
jgi:uncharacterized membrane protein